MEGMLVPLECLPSLAAVGRLSWRRWRGRILAQVADRVWNFGVVDDVEAARPAAPGRGGGRIRGDYFRRLGVTPSTQPQEVGPVPPLGLAAALAREREEAVLKGEPQSGPCEASATDRIRKDDFRVNFLRNLSYKGVLLPPTQRPPKSQTVIIFDWDDTLLPTTFLYEDDQSPVTAAVTQRLHDIAKLSQKLLETACQLGQTFIITNATDGWVEHSTATWVPELLPVLRHIPIISARAKFEAHYPQDVHQWKVQAFLEVQRQLHSEVVTNLLSVGDSDHEMKAAHIMGKQFSQATIKTVKLQQDPTPDELHKELALVLQSFERIVSTVRNLKVFLERKAVDGHVQQ